MRSHSSSGRFPEICASSYPKNYFNSAAAQRGWSVHTAHQFWPKLVHFLGPELLSNIEGNPARINSVCLFTREDGVVTISEDRVLRVYLKRETGQYWPSIHQPLLLVPTVVHLDEQSLRVFVDFVNG
ncbi:hypothetical protein QR680_000689 [Steinernema hermaphroditum]|uniref:Uncharacterized protein n=1 Tax=Steinernema hermaphroditum TaxID=289476 RepID=A0AA39GVJ1_9BILA|nr:hypothetical protein QR680_000689 [Steinernema hermaphroditum]